MVAATLSRDLRIRCRSPFHHVLKGLMNRRISLFLLLSFCFLQFLGAQVHTLYGTVVDATTLEPLVAANIRIAGTTRGTITNAQGSFRLSLEQGSHRLLISFIGYRTDTLDIAIDKPMEYHGKLQPYPIQLSEIVVTDEDPGRRIMRLVIENKKRWVDALKSFQLEAFTRQVIRRDTAIASITESYSTGYWQVGDTLREVVKQKRQTANVPGSANFAAVGGIVNFYQDEVRLSGFLFVGPTAIDAFEYYDFKLEQTKEHEGIAFHTIRIIPLSRITPLFRGTIQIVSDGYAVAGVEVSPNEAYTLPFVNEFAFTYAQQFSLYEDRFWMPVDIRIDGWASIGIAGFSFPRIGFESSSSIYEYAINIDLPDTIFQKPRRTELADASKFDSLFWARREVLPLTSEQQSAYQSLDSTQTLSKQFQPSGPLTLLGSDGFSYLRYADLRFNRVEGLFVGGNLSVDTLLLPLRLSSAGGYGFSDRRWKFSGGIEYGLDSLRKYTLGIQGFRSIGHIPDEGFYEPLAISLGALFDKNDYRDYYYSEGVSLSLKARPWQSASLQVSVHSERHRSAAQTTDYSFFSRSLSYRPNPPINEGNLRSLRLSARYGETPVPLGLISRNFVEIEVEHSALSLLSSDFDFSRIVGRGEVHIPTFSKRLFFPPLLSLRGAAGFARGTLPIQRLFSLEAGYSGYGPFGVLRGAGVKEYAGNGFFALAMEHNFRSIPFLLLDIPYLYKNSLEVIVHGGAARTWNSSGAPLPFGRGTDGWYAEAGFGLNRVLSFFRVDVTYRFAQPRTTFFSIGVARIL